MVLVSRSRINDGSEEELMVKQIAEKPSYSYNFTVEGSLSIT